ncbi:hypothetical protein KHS38_08775 [Mucilaginibacter sp. Bleaf8]|uniref:hypothetical protein n=1 Tax=Mucilaginibacter sp. Bleaf8 TaxID=2834430 RepID=UPI001BCDC072|nr:hypothetical protein [Mucilaginibacter sp. Bleaf8]MBS7564498.1 hypothetical protein [Mucilaginibacter sp. Bleaf8]
MDTPQDLIVKFSFNPDDFEKLDDFEEHLERAVTFHGIGTYEGYELDAETGGNGEFYLTTTDGDLLYKTIRPLLLDAGFLQVKQMALQAQEGSGACQKEYQL